MTRMRISRHTEAAPHRPNQAWYQALHGETEQSNAIPERRAVPFSGSSLGRGWGDIAPMHRPMPIQRKATVSVPSEPLEKAADEGADKLLRMEEPDAMNGASGTIRRKCASCEDEDAKNRLANREKFPNFAATNELGTFGFDSTTTFDPIQRKCSKCEDEEDKALIQRKNADVHPGESGLSQLSSVSAIDGTSRGQIHAMALHGISGLSGPLPWLGAIQNSFGRHDVSGIKAHTDNAAFVGASAIDALAFTTRNHVAFRGAPTLHTVAHEAAHAIQQESGIQLSGGLGTVGDRYERHADAVADLVVKGQSAESLLDAFVGANSNRHSTWNQLPIVQRAPMVTGDDGPGDNKMCRIIDKAPALVRGALPNLKLPEDTVVRVLGPVKRDRNGVKWARIVVKDSVQKEVVNERGSIQALALHKCEELPPGTPPEPDIAPGTKAGAAAAPLSITKSIKPGPYRIKAGATKLVVTIPGKGDQRVALPEGTDVIVTKVEKGNEGVVWASVTIEASSNPKLIGTKGGIQAPSLMARPEAPKKAESSEEQGAPGAVKETHPPIDGIGQATSIDALPPQIKDFLFSQTGTTAVKPEDYERVLRIANMLSSMTAAERAEYKSRTTVITSDLNAFEESINRYRAELQKRADITEEREKSSTKLAALENVYREYRAYKSLLKTGNALAGSGTPMGVGAALGAIPAQNKQWQDLTDKLARYRCSIADFEALIHRYEASFQQESLALASVMLDQYEHNLVEQEQRYSAGASAGLYKQLAPARQAYNDADQVHQDWLEAGGSMVVMSEDDMALASHYTGIRNQALARGDSAVHAVGGTDPLVTNRDFNREALARTPESGVQGFMLDYIRARRKDIVDTRKNIAESPEIVFVLNDLKGAAYRAQNIGADSIYDMIIKDHTSDLNWQKAIPHIVLGVIAIAAGLVSAGTGTAAVLGAGTAFGITSYQALETYHNYEVNHAAYGAKLLSDDPSFAWVVIAVVGAGIDLAVVGSTIAQFRPAIEAFNASKQTATDVATLSEALGGAQERVRQAVVRAAKAEVEAKEAWAAAGSTANMVFPSVSATIAAFAAKYAYPMFLSIKRLGRDFQVFLRSREFVQLAGDVSKLKPEELTALKTVFEQVVEEWGQLAKHAEKLGMSESEATAFMKMHVESPTMGVQDVLKQMDAWKAAKGKAAAQTAQPAVVNTPPQQYRNQLPEFLEEELQSAAELGIVAEPAKTALEKLVGQRIKWGLRADGELMVVPHTPLIQFNGVVLRGDEISHAVLGGAEQVPMIAVGEALIERLPTGELVGVWITPYSGHYFKGMAAAANDALPHGVDAFGKLGISFKEVQKFK